MKCLNKSWRTYNKTSDYSLLLSSHPTNNRRQVDRGKGRGLEARNLRIYLSQLGMSSCNNINNSKFLIGNINLAWKSASSCKWLIWTSTGQLCFKVLGFQKPQIHKKNKTKACHKFQKVVNEEVYLSTQIFSKWLYTKSYTQSQKLQIWPRLQILTYSLPS